ncbi:MAG TPA: DUF983 domain-containing protein [Chitinophagaceae bacterium]|nr:DUF983 domain-containing protein [Chitinophagaceae bacterium]
MCAQAKDKKPNLVLSILQTKCTRCRRGKMFRYKNVYDLKNFMKMNEHCPVCGQPLDIEPGFYFGTNMVSYTLAVLICIFTFFAWWLTIGFSLSDNRFFYWIATNAFLLIALQPPLMRISRAVWLAFFVPYSYNWDKGDIILPERMNKQQQNNW